MFKLGTEHIHKMLIIEIRKFNLSALQKTESEDI